MTHTLSDSRSATTPSRRPIRIWLGIVAAMIVGTLLVVFIVAISFNLLRGNAIDCGCFDVTAANLTREERFRDMWMVLLRDVGMLFLVAQGLLGARRVETEGESAAI